MRGAAIPFAVVFVLSGCLGSDGDDDGSAPPAVVFDPLWSEKATPFGDGHDHADAAHHLDLTTPNFRVLGFDPLVSESFGDPAGAHHCGDARETAEGLRLAVAESRSVVGFTLADVTDPAHPAYLGELVLRNTDIYDLTLTPDGRFVVFVTLQGNRDGRAPVPPPLALESGAARPEVSWRGCDGREIALASEDYGIYPSSIVLVSIEDPNSPRVVDHRPFPREGHSVFATEIDGETLILGTSRPEFSYWLYAILETPLGPKLELVSNYQPPTPGAPPTTITAGHDGWLAKHPGTGQTLAYLAGGDWFSIVDVSDPRSPVLLSQWTDATPGRDGYSGSMHSVEPFETMWGDRHYTVLGPEFASRPGELPTGVLWVLDTTDPRHPVPVAAWTLPHEVDWDDAGGAYLFSNHYFTVVEETLFLSLYHGGVWAIDLAPIRNATAFVSLPSIGVFLPADPSLPEPEHPDRWAPTLQEILKMPDGTLVTFDGRYGLYTVGFDYDVPAPNPEPWPLTSP